MITTSKVVITIFLAMLLIVYFTRESILKSLFTTNMMVLICEILDVHVPTVPRLL